MLMLIDLLQLKFYFQCPISCLLKTSDFQIGGPGISEPLWVLVMDYFLVKLKKLVTTFLKLFKQLFFDK